MELSPGAAFGPYRLVGLAGEGGMAEVWRAYDARLERDVAVKFLSRRYAGEPGYLERFRREARAISRLDHPNILPVWDFGEQDGWTYTVSPFLDGGDLAGRLGRPWSPLEALAVLEPLAAALDHAHARGIVHRDVKPSNVLFASDGRPVLGDFGVARVLEGTSALTQAGLVIGTPRYMAPEQAEGEPATPASDLYALGVVTYELLTGRAPFVAETPLAVLRAHAERPLPPPRSLNPALPETVQRVLFRALAKNPGDRFPSGAALIGALRVANDDATTVVEPLRQTLREEAASPRAAEPSVATEVPVPRARVAQHGRRWAGLAALAGLAVLGLLALGVWGQAALPALLGARPTATPEASPPSAGGKPVGEGPAALATPVLAAPAPAAAAVSPTPTRPAVVTPTRAPTPSATAPGPPAGQTPAGQGSVAAAAPPLGAPRAVSCGPNFATYTVKSLGNLQGSGIRCAQTLASGAGGVEGVIWYGEGQWGGTIYRHVGYGRGGGSGPRPASAADIYGTGEATGGVFHGTLELDVAAGGGTIRVAGAWAEEWSRVASIVYAPLPRPRTCGQHFEEYRVSDLAGQAPGSGLRCLFDRAVWFGSGEWGGTTYAHLGTMSLGADGRGAGEAADLCDPAFGAICGVAPAGSLRFARVSPRGYDVTGVWGEAWR